MKITLTSISGTALSLDSFQSTSVVTEEGVITILPGHEPIISSLKPGLLKIVWNDSTYEYALWWGVVQISPNEVRILADMIEDGWHDLEEIRQRKRLTEEKLAELRSQWDLISMESYIGLEQEYLKDIAREQFTLNR